MNRKGDVIFTIVGFVLALALLGLLIFYLNQQFGWFGESVDDIKSCGENTLFKGVCRVSCNEEYFKPGLPILCEGDGQVCCIPRKGSGAEGIAYFNALQTSMEDCYDGDEDACSLSTELLEAAVEESDAVILFALEEDPVEVRYTYGDETIEDFKAEIAIARCQENNGDYSSPSEQNFRYEKGDDAEFGKWEERLCVVMG